MALGRTTRPRESLRDIFPSITVVITIHSLSLLATLVLGMALFLFQAPLIYYLIAVFLTGPIYTINLYYLIKYLDFVERKVKGLLEKLDRERRKQAESSDSPSQDRSKMAANDYLLNKVYSETSRDIIDRRLLYISMFTPIWPVTFYYTLYRVFGFISTYEDLLENYSFSTSKNTYKNERAIPSDISFFETSLKHKVIFSSFALISVIGFAFTFYIISAGFFALFWVILLHYRLSAYVEKNKDGPALFGMNKNRRYITVSLILAFLCFGATSGFLAMFSNTFYSFFSFPLGLISPTVLAFFVVSVIAPLIEEPVKVAGLFLVDKERSKSIPLFYWAFFGAIAGFGFALIENYSYFQTFFAQYSTIDSLYLLLMRFSFPVHMIGSALAGSGVGLWRKKDSLAYPILFVLLAVLVHGSFNFIVTLGGG